MITTRIRKRLYSYSAWLVADCIRCVKIDFLTQSVPELEKISV